MAIANDSNILGFEQFLEREFHIRGDIGGGTLSAQLLTKEIFMAVDSFPDGVLEPVVLLWEGDVLERVPPLGIIQRLRVRPKFSNGSSDSLRERLSACLSVETHWQFQFGGIFGSGDKATEQVGDANPSTAIVGDVDNQPLGLRRL